MGSSGTGKLSDYSRNKPTRQQGGGGSGSAGSDDRCSKAFTATLEDVQQSDFFKSNKSGPRVGTDLQITLRKRIVAETSAGQSVGNLPTKFNYLAGCLEAGFKYVGKVVSSSGPPGTKVTVDFAPLT